MLTIQLNGKDIPFRCLHTIGDYIFVYDFENNQILYTDGVKLEFLFNLKDFVPIETFREMCNSYYSFMLND